MKNFILFIFSISVLASFTFYTLKVKKESIDFCDSIDIQSCNIGLGFVPSCHDLCINDDCVQLKKCLILVVEKPN